MFFTKIYYLVHIHSFLLRKYKYKLFLWSSRNITSISTDFQNRLSKWNHNHRSSIVSSIFFFFFDFSNDSSKGTIDRQWTSIESSPRSNSSTTIDQHSPLFFRDHEQFFHLKQTHSALTCPPHFYSQLRSTTSRKPSLPTSLNRFFRLDRFVEARVSSKRTNPRETTLSNFVFEVK